MNEESAGSYLQIWKISEVVFSNGIGVVEQSKSNQLKVGDIVSDFNWPWQTKCILDGSSLKKVSHVQPSPPESIIYSLYIISVYLRLSSILSCSQIEVQLQSTFLQLLREFKMTTSAFLLAPWGGCSGEEAFAAIFTCNIHLQNKNFVFSVIFFHY